MNRNFYISDLHIGHENILKFDNRPFKNIDEMFHALLNNWNKVVDNTDTVYIIGDFIWKTEKHPEEIIKQFNGHKVLVLGNHDLTSGKGLQEVTPYKEIIDSGYHVILSHYPMLFYRASYNPNCVMLCGHVHLTRENDFLQQWKLNLQQSHHNQTDSLGQIINVGCMMPYMHYTPQPIQELVKFIFFS